MFLTLGENFDFNLFTIIYFRQNMITGGKKWIHVKFSLFTIY